MNERSIDRSDLDALERAQRLQELGIAAPSPELRETAETLRHFAQHGNRAMRRQAAKATKRARRG